MSDLADPPSNGSPPGGDPPGGVAPGDGHDAPGGVTLVSATEVRIDVLESDPGVVQGVKDAGDDAEEAVRRWLVTGRQVEEYTVQRGELNSFTREMTQLENDLKLGIEQSIGNLKAQADDLILGNGGAVEQIGQLMAVLETRLGDALDPAKKQSLISIVTDELRAYVQGTEQDLRNYVDPTQTTSPLNGMKAELEDLLKQHQAGIEQRINQVLIQVGGNIAAAAVISKTTLKGGPFEQQVLAGGPDRPAVRRHPRVRRAAARASGRRATRVTSSCTSTSRSPQSAGT